MNYQALGEYHAYKKQAEDAAMKRFALLHNLSTHTKALADNPAKPVDVSEIRASVDQIDAAERELQAAIKRANEAAALCGENGIAAESLMRKQG